MSIMNYELSIVNYELSIVNYELSIVNYELSIVNYELSIVNYELSIVNCQLWFFSDAKVSIFVFHPPSLPHEKARKCPISEKNLPPLRSPPLTCHVCFAIPRFSTHPYPLFQATRPYILEKTV